MSTLAWIVGSSLLMSAIALVGSVTLVLKEETLQRIILPLVAFAAGSLIGGAFFHMIPAGIAQSGNNTVFYVWILAGFSAFFALEQLLNWRLRPRARSKRARKSSCQHCEFHCIHLRSCIDAAYQSGAGSLMFWNSRRTTGFVY